MADANFTDQKRISGALECVQALKKNIWQNTYRAMLMLRAFVFQLRSTTRRSFLMLLAQ